jgi:hypothetical protein
MADKLYGFVDSKYDYNPHWDIAWSFTFALSGTEHGFTSFLSQNNTTLSCFGGESLGYYSNTNIANGIFAVAFDSTGRFALPIGPHPGVALSAIKPNALIIRDSNNEVILNETLSSLHKDFVLTQPNKKFQTIRFRYINGGKKISIDYRVGTSSYITLTSVALTAPNLNLPLYPGFTFCSPINSVIDPSLMYVKDFHTQGNINTPTTETVEYIPLTSYIINQYTTISGITANPLQISS